MRLITVVDGGCVKAVGVIVEHCRVRLPSRSLSACKLLALITHSLRNRLLPMLAVVVLPYKVSDAI